MVHFRGWPLFIFRGLSNIFNKLLSMIKFDKLYSYKNRFSIAKITDIRRIFDAKLILNKKIRLIKNVLQIGHLKKVWFWGCEFFKTIKTKPYFFFHYTLRTRIDFINWKILSIEPNFINEKQIVCLLLI